VVAMREEQQKALEMALEERDRQDVLWGEQRDNPDLLWLAVLAEEYGEAAKTVLEEPESREVLLEEVTQVAAVALSWMESLIRERRPAASSAVEATTGSEAEDEGDDEQ